MTVEHAVYVVMGAAALSFLGNTINALGLIMQKQGHIRVNERRKIAHYRLYKWQLEAAGHIAPGSPKRSQPVDIEADQHREEALVRSTKEADADTFLTESVWLYGFGIYVVGSLMHVAALGFGPQALLMPMEGVTLAANAMLAPACLGERLTRQALYGTLVTCFGIGMTVAFGPHGSVTYTADEMVQRFTDMVFLAWSMFIAMSTMAAFFLQWIVRERNEAQGVLMDGNMDRPGARILCFAYIWIAGVFSSSTMLTAKQTMELLETTAGGHNQFNSLVPFIILFNFLMMNFLMEYWKQKALSTFPAIIVVPLFQVSLVVLSVVGGAIYFDEFHGMEIWKCGLFILGLVVVCAGIAILAMDENQKPTTTVFSSAVAILFTIKLRRIHKWHTEERAAALSIAASTPPHTPANGSSVPEDGVASEYRLPPPREHRGSNIIMQPLAELSPSPRALPPVRRSGMHASGPLPAAQSQPNPSLENEENVQPGSAGSELLNGKLKSSNPPHTKVMLSSPQTPQVAPAAAADSVQQERLERRLPNMPDSQSPIITQPAVLREVRERNSEDWDRLPESAALNSHVSKAVPAQHTSIELS